MIGQVDTALEVWVLVLVNFLGFILGAVVTALSYYAYRAKKRDPSLRNATIGFALLTVGTAVEPAYQLGVNGTRALATERNLGLQILAGGLVSLGFLVLFLSIYGYSSHRRQQITVNGVDDDLFDNSD